MHFLFLDESGDTEPPASSRHSTPVMVILGVIVHAQVIPPLTREFLALKRRFFPHWFYRGPALDHVLTEVKGSDILKLTRSDSRDRRRLAKLVRLELLGLLDRYDCQILGRVWVKEPGRRLKADATYCYAVQDIASHLCHFLDARLSHGMVVADSRNPNFDVKVAHSIFTQKWRTGEDPYQSLLEVPLFANSRNHVGLQIADLLASTLVLPMAASAYGAPEGNVHSSDRYHAVRADHGPALRELQYRYVDETGRWRGGLVVSDPAGRRPGSLLFGNGEQMVPTQRGPVPAYAEAPA